MVAYPSSIYVPSHLIPGVTVLEKSLFFDAYNEVDAIENELGIEPHGTQGSIRRRIDLFCDPAGICMPRVKDGALAATERRRCRMGVSEIEVDDLTAATNSHLGTVTFAPATQGAVDAYLSLQLPEGSDFSDTTLPALANYVESSGSTSTFNFRVASASNAPSVAGSSFLLHWFVIERAASAQLDLP